jgi:hypothetical protein
LSTTATESSSSASSAATSTGTGTLRLIESSDTSGIIILVVTTSIELTHPSRILGTLTSLRDKAFPSRWSTSLCTGRTNITRIDKLKFLGFLAVNFVLKFQIFIGIVTCGAATEVSGCGVSGAGEGLGGEIGAAAETIGAAEGGVGEIFEAAYGGVGGGGG